MQVPSKSTKSEVTKMVLFFKTHRKLQIQKIFYRNIENINEGIRKVILFNTTINGIPPNWKLDPYEGVNHMYLYYIYINGLLLSIRNQIN